MVILMGVQGMERSHRNMIHHRLLGNMDGSHTGPSRFSHGKLIEGLH